MKHDLVTPDAWVELRDYRELRAKDRKVVLCAMFGEAELKEEGGGVQRPTAGVAYASAFNASEMTAALLITGWNIPYLPGALVPNGNPEILGELTIEDSDALFVIVAPAVSALMPGADRPSPDQAADPTSPTVPVRA